MCVLKKTQNESMILCPKLTMCHKFRCKRSWGMSRFAFLLVAVLLGLGVVNAWQLNNKMVPRTWKQSVAAVLSTVGLLSSAASAELTPAPWDSTVQYEVIQKGTGGAGPKASDLVNIRFKGGYKGTVFDNTFKSEQPYTYRAGVGLLLPGIDNAVVNMKVGDKYHLVFNGENSFKDGRPSAPGVPRIPPGGELDYEVLVESMPGTDEDIILGDL